MGCAGGRAVASRNQLVQLARVIATGGKASSPDILPRPTTLRWLHDVFDNSVAIARFKGMTSELRFDSTVTLEHVEMSLSAYALGTDAQTQPLRYAEDERPEDERPDLAGALKRRHPA